MDPITAALATIISVLLFAVSFLLGERRAKRQETARVQEAEPIPAQEPAAISDPIPQTSRRTRSQTENNQLPKGMRIVGPAEAIARARREKDGLVEERVPPAVAEEFLTEANQINTNSRRQENGNR